MFNVYKKYFSLASSLPRTDRIALSHVWNANHQKVWQRHMIILLWWTEGLIHLPILKFISTSYFLTHQFDWSYLGLHTIIYSMQCHFQIPGSWNAHLPRPLTPLSLSLSLSLSLCNSIYLLFSYFLSFTCHLLTLYLSVWSYYVLRIAFFSHLLLVVIHNITHYTTAPPPPPLYLSLSLSLSLTHIPSYFPFYF